MDSDGYNNGVLSTSVYFLTCNLKGVILNQEMWKSLFLLQNHCRKIHQRIKFSSITCSLLSRLQQVISEKSILITENSYIFLNTAIVEVP